MAYLRTAKVPQFILALPRLILAPPKSKPKKITHLFDGHKWTSADTSMGIMKRNAKSMVRLRSEKGCQVFGKQS